VAGKKLDPAMANVVKLFEQSGKTLDQLGQEMGYSEDAARKCAWQFLEKTTDPHISMLRRFAKAMGIPIEALFQEGETMSADRGEATMSMFLDAGLLPDEQKKVRQIDGDVFAVLAEAGMNERAFWTSSVCGDRRTVVFITKTRTFLEVDAEKFSGMKNSEILRRLKNSLSGIQ
jgi:hypothetical protein